MFKSGWNLITRSCNQLQVRNGWSTNQFTQRGLAVVSVHRSFPASLFRMSWGHTSNLYDHTKTREGLDLPCDGVSISKDGLVYPARLDSGVSNGLDLMPNTQFAQECFRHYWDYYEDNLQADKSVESPVIFRVQKGTFVPEHLILFRKHSCVYTLQPSHGMTLHDLNKTMDTFFKEYSTAHPAQQWLQQHTYQAAFDDDASEEWSAV